MVPYLSGIGLSQFQIGMSQATFMLAAFCFDIPAGWLADKTSRKSCVVVADIVMALCFLAYTQVDSFLDVLLLEALLGIGVSLISGSDDGLVAAYCQRLRRDMSKELILHHQLAAVSAAVLLAMGGFVAANFGYTWAFIFGAGPYVFGAIVTALLKDIAPPKVTFSDKRDIKTALREMASIVRLVMVNQQLRWAVLAGATSIQMCRTLFIVQTPLLLLVGVPLEVVGVMWAAQQGAVLIGTTLAKRYVFQWHIQRLFVMPMFLSLASMALLAVTVTWWTIGLYGLIAIAGGWSSAVARPIFNTQVPAQDIMSTAASVRTSVYMIFYIVGVLVVGLGGNFGVQWALLANVVLFLPFAVLCAKYLPAKFVPQGAQV